MIRPDMLSNFLMTINWFELTAKTNQPTAIRQVYINETCYVYIQLH